MKMKKLKKDQRGITLIELVIAIALTGVITAAITMAVFQVFTMNTRTSNRMAAVSQVQHAGKLVSEDILQAQSVETGVSLGFPLTLTWTDWDKTVNEVTYSITVDNRLKRSLKITPDGEEPTTKVSIVAEYIDPTETSCDPTGKVLTPGEVLTFTVTATVGEQSETREYKVKPRPGSS